jgi:hypothetical protein
MTSITVTRWCDDMVVCSRSIAAPAAIAQAVRQISRPIVGEWM